MDAIASTILGQLGNTKIEINIFLTLITNLTWYYQATAWKVITKLRHPSDLHGRQLHSVDIYD